MSERVPNLTVVDWLDRLWALTLREIKSYFYSPVAWIAMTVFLFVQGFLFFGLIEHYSQQSELAVAGSSHLFRFSLVLLTFLCPALTMHLLASEWSNRSIEGLLTAPVTEVQVVLSKYIAAMAFYSSMLATMGVYLIILGSYGRWEFGPIASSFLGLLMIGGVFLGFGVLASSLTQSQLVAYLVSFLFDITMTWGMNLIERFASNVELKELVLYISIERHFGDFTRGVVRTPPLVFYISSVALFLFLSVRSLESRKWG